LLDSLLQEINGTRCPILSYRWALLFPMMMIFLLSLSLRTISPAKITILTRLQLKL